MNTQTMTQPSTITERLERARMRDTSGRPQGGTIMPSWKDYRPARRNGMTVAR